MTHKPKKRRFYDDSNRQAFVRWRENTMKQMTAASSVLFAVSSAGMGYVLALLADEAKQPNIAGRLSFTVFAVSLALSFVAGVFLVINRLEDFRRTSNIVKLRDENDEARASGTQMPHPGLDDLRDESRLLGRLTWFLFYVQLFGIGVGGGAFMYLIWSLYGSRFTT